MCCPIALERRKAASCEGAAGNHNDNHNDNDNDNDENDKDDDDEDVRSISFQSTNVSQSQVSIVANIPIPSHPLPFRAPQLLQSRVSETSSSLLSETSTAAAAAISSATIRFNARHDAEIKAM